MARQNRTNKQAEEQTEAQTQEAPVTETTTEAPAETAAETPINLDAFKAAVETALTEADTSTGEVPASAIGPVNEAYRALDGQKPKNAARSFLEEQMLEAVGQLDAAKARSYNDLRANLSAGSGAKSEKAPAAPTAAFVQRVASLRLALSIVEGQRPEGEGIDEKVEALVTESSDAVASYQAWLDAETPEGEEKPAAPEVSPVVRAAFKAASGKASGGARVGGGSSSGVRRDIGKHIQSAFAGVEVGTFLTIAEIAKHKSEEYGDDSPSQGAISARLFPTTTVEGVEPVEKGAIDGKNPKGARKTA